MAKEIGSHFQVVIKEFFPNSIVRRAKDSQVLLVNNATEERLRHYKFMKQVFEEEAQNLASINRMPHKNIEGFTFFEKDFNNTMYLGMPYVEGEELTNYLFRKKEQGQKLSQREIIKIIIPILKGLTHIHKYGIYHKDIKPANIFMRKDDNEPMIIDFGASITSANLLTRAYAPIEQINKQKDIYGPYTDIYATAVMMYEMVTGKLPPRSQDRAEVLLKDGVDSYVPLVQNRQIKGYSKSFLKAIDKALSFKYEDRPRNCEEFEKLLKKKSWFFNSFL